MQWIQSHQRFSEVLAHILPFRETVLEGLKCGRLLYPVNVRYDEAFQGDNMRKYEEQYRSM